MDINEERLYKLIGARIRQNRKAQGLTQASLARKMGVERTSVTNIESGKQHTPLHILYRLCILLEMDIRELLPDFPEIMESNPPVLPSMDGTVRYAE